MIVVAFDDNMTSAKLPTSVINKLGSVGWRQIGVADHSVIGEIVFDGDPGMIAQARTALNEWIERLGRSAQLNDEDTASETSSLEKPDVKTDDVVDSKVTLKRQIGRGQFATVWSGTLDGTLCAIKLFTTDAEYADVVEREVTAIKDIGEHSNIVRMLIHGHDANYNCGYIVYERMTCDLFSALRQQGAMPLSTAVRAFASIIKGLEHVHSKGIAHADVKPENVLVDSQGRVCLADFGGCMRMNEQGVCDGDESMHVTTEYRAPEVILDDEYHLKSDVWSAAVLLYELCTAEPLFPIDDESDDEDDESDEDEPDLADKHEVDDVVIAEEIIETAAGKINDEKTDVCKAVHTSLLQVDVPVQIDESTPQAPGSDDEDSDDDSNFDLNEALDELTDHQKKVTQLACMVRVLGAFPKVMAKKYNDVFTPDGHVLGFEADQKEPLSALLQKASVNTRDVAILMSIFTSVLKYQASKRPTPSEVLQIRAMREFS